MSKSPSPIRLQLTRAEALEIAFPEGPTGGHQNLHRQIVDGLSVDLILSVDDELLGKIIRYATQYGSGGFQGRLKRAFRRSIVELMT